MHITDIIKGDSPTFSFEFFPPKTPEAAETLYQTIRDLESYTPHFVSVTYGAGGSTRDLTHDLVERIKHDDEAESDPAPDLRLPQRAGDRSDPGSATRSRRLETFSRWAAIGRATSPTTSRATRFNTRPIW